jgi:hypothetical protein
MDKVAGPRGTEEDSNQGLPARLFSPTGVQTSLPKQHTLAGAQDV